jgi:Flp pilus assembly protein TadG
VRRFRPARRDEGAAAVEFALLFPIFMILALGIINGGFAFSRQINVTQAAREASRYGSTYSVTAAGGLTNWLNSVDSAMCQAINNGHACSPSQASNPVAGYDFRCVAFIARNTDAGATINQANSGYKMNDAAPVTNTSSFCNNAFTVPNLGPGTKVVVTVLSRDVKFFVLFINPTLHLDAVSTTPYEPPS